MRSVNLIQLLLLLFVAAPVFGQDSPRQHAVAAFDAGVQHLLDGHPRRAQKSLSEAVTRDPAFLPALRLLGVARDLDGDHAGALEAYLEVLRRDSVYSRLLYFQIGDVYLRSGAPRQALDYFARFEALQATDISAFGLAGEQEAGAEERVLRVDLPRQRVSAQMSADSNNYVNARDLHRLGPAFNGPHNDYFPFFTNDGNGVYFTRQDADGDEDLIVGRRPDSHRGDGTFSTRKFGTFNTRQPEGMCTLVRDGETIFFTLCHEVPDGGSCDLHAGLLTNGRIEHTTKLPAYLNSPTWDSQAAISCDGRQLLFASTRPGGIGGSDLYACERLPDGSWSEPVNLGAAINTPEDEEAPFLSNDGETLYFSSMGHTGLGDQDIFFSRRDPVSGRWTPARNIGPPINSPARELGFHLTPDGRTGYFASNRPGGAGGLDIYGFTLAEELTGKEVTYVSGYLTDSLSGEPLPGQAVPVAGGDVFHTNAAGRFFICAPPERALPLTVDRAGYLPYARSFHIPAWPNREPYRIDLRLAPPGSVEPAPPPPPPTPPAEREMTHRVLFAFEQGSPSEAEAEALRRFVSDLDLERVLSVTVTGYTDETGSAAFNERLSQYRADAVARLLGAAGISPERIIATGRGEVNAHPDRRLNRKVEILLRIR